MLRTISDLIPHDPDLPDRSRTVDILTRVLDGTLYDVLPYEFHEERTGSGDYIPLRERRPSVRYGLARLVVEDSISLLFSDGHFPLIDSPDVAARNLLECVFRDCRLNAVMTEAGLRGSVGSVALLMRILRGRVFVSVLTTGYLTPEWDPLEPDTLIRIRERYKVTGAELLSRGYPVDDQGATFWFMRDWDADSETWYVPQAVEDASLPVIDEVRSVQHQLGFVPVIWIRNLPGGDSIDGGCTFRAAVETSIEIDYQLSQAGRGLKYSSDPTLLIREPAGLEGSVARGAANALVVSEKGDAKLLEIGGTASQAVLDYVRILREFALESVHGNRADASRLAAPASGRSLELMNQGLLWLADNLRVSYGQGAILSLARMILRASKRYRLRAEGRDLPDVDDTAPISLRWPSWYPDDALDRQRVAETVTTLVAARQISRQTALHILGQSYDIEDVGAELKRIEAEGAR